MKKFNPEKEIKKNKKRKIKVNNSFVNKAFILMLVVGCMCMAFIGITFSYKLDQEEKSYSIDLVVLDGEDKTYHFDAKEGEFNMSLATEGELNGVDCESGYVEYDSFTQTVKIPYLNKDTKCNIIFREEAGKYLSLEGMYSINDNDGVSYYYPGDANNNYLLLNNIMFRIVRVNGDGTLRLILDDNSLTANYGNRNDYNDSNIKNILKEWFEKNIGDNKLVVEGSYDISNYSAIEDDSLVNLDTSLEDVVGLLNAKEASLIIKENKDNYLGDMLLLNGTIENKVWATKEGEIIPVDISEEYIVKPVINIKDVDMDGFGSEDNPYIPKED